ncbi:hypothetical protein [Flavobacterium sp.]|uniref:hypothetical protein n=1 Tax=Flavobacterium sp. TaxID=239 RepID=UPI002621CFC6|nr:hypothetical protein [Flavobacterium sp.]
MSAFISIGHRITVASLRDFIITHTLNAGDSLVVSSQDFQELVHEIKSSSEGIPDIPFNLLGVNILQDPTDAVPVGKLQIVKNEQSYL